MKRAFPLLLVFFTTALFAADKWSTPYQKGTAAVQKGDWKTVAEQMQKAIAAKSNEEAFTKLKGSSGPYVPYYWLGTARMNLGDSAGAAEAFRSSQSQGAIQKTAHYADLRAAFSRLEGTSREKENRELAAARKNTDQTLNRAMAGKVQATTAGATRQASYRRGAQKLQEAFDLKKSGNLQQAAAAASQASDLFQQAAADEKKARSNGAVIATRRDTPAKEPATIEIPKATVKGDPPPVVIAQTEAAPPQESTSIKARSEAERSLRSLRGDLLRARTNRKNDAAIASFTSTSLELLNEWEKSLKAGAGGSELEAIKRGVTQQKRQLEIIAASTIVPPKQSDTRSVKAQLEMTGVDLKSAYVQLARGEFAAAEQATSALLQRDPRLFQAYMLRACARYTLATLTNRKELEAAAASDFKAALAINPAAKLDSRSFSPKLVTFFNDVRRQRG